MSKPLDPHNYMAPNTPDVRPRIAVMRHPQTVANEQMRYLGQENMPLSELGRWQLPRAIEAVVAFAPRAIVCSPLERCLAIAEPAANKLGIQLEVDKRLQELGFGLLEGLTASEAIEQGLSFPWGPTAHNWPVEGGETLEAFVHRVSEAADELKARNERVFVVTHGGVVRALTSYWLGIPSERFWAITVRNVETIVFSNDGDNLYFERFGLEPEWLSASM